MSTAAAPLEPEDVVDCVLAVEATIVGLLRELSFFEVLALAALVVFALSELDAIVVDAGRGGRLDATRLVARAVVVTAIARYHERRLGDTLGAVAAERLPQRRPRVHP